MVVSCFIFLPLPGEIQFHSYFSNGFFPPTSFSWDVSSNLTTKTQTKWKDILTCLQSRDMKIMKAKPTKQWSNEKGPMVGWVI